MFALFPLCLRMSELWFLWLKWLTWFFFGGGWPKQFKSKTHPLPSRLAGQALQGGESPLRSLGSRVFVWIASSFSWRFMKMFFCWLALAEKEIVSLIYISPQAGWALHFLLDQKTKQKSQGSQRKASSSSQSLSAAGWSSPARRDQLPGLTKWLLRFILLFLKATPKDCKVDTIISDY